MTSAASAQAMLDAWRERGDDRVSRMRFRTIEALAQRASLQQGEVRRVIDARLAQLLDAYARDVALADEHATATDAPGRTPLADLLDDMKRRGETYPAPADYLDALRSIWSTVSAEKRLRESLAHVPKNAGPLNSSSLVHRSLSLMREVSPDYLQHFLGYVDALSWMEEMTFAAGPAKEAPRAAAAKKSTRKAR